MIIEFSVRPPGGATHGRDGVWAGPSSLLEQLVDATVWQLSAPSSKTMQLEMQLLGGEQTCLRVLGVGIGRHQQQRREVVAIDPGGAARVEHLGPVPQPQHEPLTLREGDA